MARAGFYAIHSSTIRFGRDGRWYSDDEPITNTRIADLFSKHVVRRPDGSYGIEIGWDKAPIEVEDTPYVVARVDAGADGAFYIELNDESRELLDVTSLSMSDENVLYCSVKGGAERARFLRAAYYQLAPHFHEAGGRFYVRAGGRDHAIA